MRKPPIRRATSRRPLSRIHTRPAQTLGQRLRLVMVEGSLLLGLRGERRGVKGAEEMRGSTQTHRAEIWFKSCMPLGRCVPPLHLRWQGCGACV